MRVANIAVSKRQKISNAARNKLLDKSMPSKVYDLEFDTNYNKISTQFVFLY